MFLPMITAVSAASISMCGMASQPAPSAQQAARDEASLDHLRFLEGRWQGTAPDGTTFYEQYDRPDPRTWRSRRFKDAGFTEVTDGSTVSLKDGQVISTWGDFTWRASAIRGGYAAFEPVNAPSAFTWRRVDPDTVEVTQNWQDDKGVAQSYALRLKRVRP